MFQRKLLNWSCLWKKHSSQIDDDEGDNYRNLCAFCTCLSRWSLRRSLWPPMNFPLAMNDARQWPIYAFRLFFLLSSTSKHQNILADWSSNCWIFSRFHSFWAKVVDTWPIKRQFYGRILNISDVFNQNPLERWKRLNKFEWKSLTSL